MSDFELPTRGAVVDRHGVVHEIFGNFTACDQQWCGNNRYLSAILYKGWSVHVGCVTCLWCWEDWAVCRRG